MQTKTQSKIQKIEEFINSIVDLEGRETAHPGALGVYECFKSELITQVQKVGEIDAKMYRQALKALPTVYKTIVRRNKWITRAQKDVIFLERHTYAPELNKLHFEGNKKYNVPQCTSIEQALLYLYNGL